MNGNLGKIAQSIERIKAVTISKENLEKIKAETALMRTKPTLMDFIDDLVHRPPNKEQVRQILEVLLKEQQAIARLTSLMEQWLESDRNS